MVDLALGIQTPTATSNPARIDPNPFDFAGPRL